MATKSDKGALARAARKADALLREMVAITLKTDLTRNQRTSLETCITVHMHQKETSGARSRTWTCFRPLGRRHHVGQARRRRRMQAAQP